MEASAEHVGFWTLAACAKGNSREGTASLSHKNHAFLNGQLKRMRASAETNEES
ncbi:hypothetical protein [Geotalea sp. SG265]|uniref:hypothetical protein n=1 Tax=Geotalea sp. SG265 TaxID=2922867 RepID=UPI001FAF9F36|nr:hypothetical protein [Geotalea sp. SG265]